MQSVLGLAVVVCTVVLLSLVGGAVPASEVVPGAAGVLDAAAASVTTAELTGDGQSLAVNVDRHETAALGRRRRRRHRQHHHHHHHQQQQQQQQRQSSKVRDYTRALYPTTTCRV